MLVWTLRAVALAASAIVVFVAVFLLVESLPALRAVGIGRFLRDPSWHPAGGIVTGLLLLAMVVVLVAVAEYMSRGRLHA